MRLSQSASVVKRSAAARKGPFSPTIRKPPAAALPETCRPRAVAIRRARDRYQTAGLPDFLRIVLQAEHGEEQNPDSDVDVRVDNQAIAVRPERDAVLADRRPLP
jgi:hypothetical protein